MPLTRERRVFPCFAALSRPSPVISDPLKAEPFKLIQLLVGTVVRTVATPNPPEQMPLNLLDAEVGLLLLDVCNGVLKIERSSVRPDKFALLGVDLNILH